MPRKHTSEPDSNRSLRIALALVGVTFIAGIATLMRAWPAGFAWTPAQGEYEAMFVGVYATLGLFLLIASRQPDSHRSLILFTAWSSIVHGLIMAMQAILDATERMHLVGDAPALLLIGAGLLVLLPRSRSEETPPVRRGG